MFLPRGFVRAPSRSTSICDSELATLIAGSPNGAAMEQIACMGPGDLNMHAHAELGWVRSVFW